MDGALFLGIDVGTSGIRAIAVDINGKIHGDARVGMPCPKTGADANKIEQDPAIWWQACCQCLAQLGQQIDLQHIHSLCIDGTSSTLVLADVDGQPVTPAMMYNDSRGENQLDSLKRLGVPDDSPVNSASSSLAKLMWAQQQGLLEQTRYILHQCDWITSRFSRRLGLSDSNNCVKLGYDTQQHAWPDWLKSLPLALDQFPQVFTPGTVIARIEKSVAKQLGLSLDTRICAGTTDSTAGVIATGIREIGSAVTSLGSTMVLKVLSDKAINAPEFGVYSQPLFDHWLVGGASNSGGASLLNFFSAAQLDAMSQQINPEQTTNLDYYPLAGIGERFPVNDPQKRSRCEPRPDDDLIFFQGLLESIATIEKQGYDLLASLGAPYPSSIVSVGGGASNLAWQRIRSKKLNVPVKVAAQQQAAYGAALLAKMNMASPIFFNES